MKNCIYILLLSIAFISCEKEKTISEELVGDWMYEREANSNISNFEDLDTAGLMSFASDETGIWSQSNGFVNYSLEWDLQSNDEKISITKFLNGSQVLFPINRIYDLQRTDEDNFTFTYDTEFDVVFDTINVLQQFEQIILKRIK